MKINEHLIFQVPLAHRGIHNEQVDENSIPSFKLAVEQGFGLEIDIHLTKDNGIVVMHDYTTTRTTGIDKHINELTRAELTKIKLTKTQTKIPLLQDVLDVVDGKVPILIELKAEGKYKEDFAKIVIDSLKNYKHKDTIALQSFNPYLVKEMRLLQDEIIVGQLASNNLEGQTKFIQFLFRSLIVLKISKPHFFAYELKYIKRRKIQRKRRKLPLLAWTVTTKEEQKLAQKYADNIIFENIKP